MSLLSDKAPSHTEKSTSIFNWIGWRIVAIATLLPICVVLIVSSNVALKKKKLMGNFGKEQAYLHANDASIPWLALGFREFAADILWLRTIMYFGGHLRRAQNTATITHLLNSTINADPWFEAPYRFGSAMLMVNGGRQSNVDTMAAIDVLKRASARFPSDYHFPLKVGSYYLSELRGSDAEKKEWNILASEWISKAAILGDDVPWLPSLAANLLDKSGRRELAIQKLKEAYLITDDLEKKNQIKQSIKKLMGEKLAAELEKNHKITTALKENSPLDYLDDDAFIMLHAW